MMKPVRRKWPPDFKRTTRWRCTGKIGTLPTEVFLLERKPVADQHNYLWTIWPGYFYHGHMVRESLSSQHGPVVIERIDPPNYVRCHWA